MRIVHCASQYQKNQDGASSFSSVLRLLHCYDNQTEAYLWRNLSNISDEGNYFNSKNQIVRV